MSQATEVFRKLAAPIPANLISFKTLKGTKIKFVSWVDYVGLLDTRVGVGCWSWSVNQITITPHVSERIAKNEQGDIYHHLVGSRLVLVGTLSLLIEGKIYTQSATGTEELNCSSYGDCSSNAEAMALRRCCAKFNLGLELWRK